MIDKDKFREACQELRKHIRISEYLSNEDFIRNIDGEGMVRCPFPDHNDSTPSFSYTDKKGLFNCFGCERGGDIVNLHYYMRKFENNRISKVSTVKELSKKYNVKIPNFFDGDKTFKRVKRYRKVRVKNDEFKRKFYREKIKGIESNIKKLNNVDIKIKLYRLIDRMYFGELNEREVFLKVKRVLSSNGDYKGLL